VYRGEPALPKSTGLEIPAEEQAQTLAALRRSRDGYLLALHIVLLSAAGRNPTDIAAVLFCSRSSVYRTVRAYREGTLSWEHDEQGAAPDTAAVADGPAQGTPASLWLVPHAMERCHAGHHIAKQAGDRGLGRDHAPLAA
jgi:Homeodomain-like domain